MRDRRALAVTAGGAVLWILSRYAGSPGLDTVAVGIMLLPAIAILLGKRSRHQLRARRHLSEARIAPGTPVTVSLEITNESTAETPFLLLEDMIPDSLGVPARLVLPGIPGRATQTASYEVVPRVRGRHRIGPLRIDVTDSFALGRTRLRYSEIETVVVTPVVEPLTGVPPAPLGTGRGDSAARHLFRTGDEFSAIRQYHVGDDLRRIHWPSVARSGALMIRQDESARRSSACVFLDTRNGALGASQAPGFEKAVSAAASIGVHLARSGYTLRLIAGGEQAVAVAGENALLDALSAVEDSTRASMELRALRSTGGADVTLVAVTGIPQAHEIAALTGAGVSFGRRIAVFVHPADPETLTLPARHEIDLRTAAAYQSFVRAGWDVFVLSPTEKLSPRWNTYRNRLREASVSSF